MKKALLDVIQCPKCRSSLMKKKDVLTCKKCKCSFDVKEVPLLYYNPDVTLQEKVRAMFNETPYGLVGAKQVLKNRKKITAESLKEEPWCIPFEVKGKKILDAGCGGGNLVSRIKLLGGNAYGLDQTRGSLKQIKENFEKYNEEPPHLIEGNIEYIPLKNNTFDAINCHGVLHHSNDMNRGFSELTRVLKKGGTLYFMLYHKNCLWKYVKDVLRFGARRSKLFFNLIVKLTPHWMGTTAKQSDPRTVFRDNIVNAITDTVTVKDVKKICKANGLKIKNIRICEIPSLYGFGKRVYDSKWLQWYARRFGWLLYVEAVKE
jgi:ubiquinone/menaquinone biosynthesis C-methylase UbiE/uncharacterized protein YbaR (Trm112 family)